MSAPEFRGHESLRCHLPAEHTRPLFLRVVAAEDVDLDLLEIEQLDEAVQPELDGPSARGF